jgi:hypothetical protein
MPASLEDSEHKRMRIGMKINGHFLTFAKYLLEPQTSFLWFAANLILRYQVTKQLPTNLYDFFDVPLAFSFHSC